MVAQTDQTCYDLDSAISAASLTATILPLPLARESTHTGGPVDVQQFSVGKFTEIYACLSGLDSVLAVPMDRQSLQLYINNIPRMEQECNQLGLKASASQAARIMGMWAQMIPCADIRNSVKELRSRIVDELFGVCFYYVLPNKASMLAEGRTYVDPFHRQTDLKSAHDYFGKEILQRFPAIAIDLNECIKCYVYECLPACVFHLMRATEIGIPKVARLCAIADAKPSWGAVLERAERLTQKTKFDDLPEALKPHIDFLRSIVADMRSLQRAWRNKVTHVEDRLTPASSEVDMQDVHEILVATHSFLRHLAEGLPPWC